jgi:hypothetical protein
MKPNPEIKSVVIFTGTTWQAGMVVSLLGNANIDAYLFEGSRGTYNPGWNLPGEGGSVRVAVSSMNYDEAIPIVDEYIKNLRPD